jgi:phosphopantothenoylcysteine decarboxylase/phosphopantothenate--cysteine ligase
LACGDEGVGRLSPIGDIVRAVEVEARRVRSLRDVRVLVTAGGTREPIDPIRYLGNRSSGRQGIAIADEAARRGADVTLVVGATDIATPRGCAVIRAETAEEMHASVLDAADEADVVVMAAAVADYRPSVAAGGKIKKGEDPITIELVRTPDILADLGALEGERVLVGFAAETGELVERAREKLRAKSCDLIVANDVSNPSVGMGAVENRVVFVTDKEAEETEVMSKAEVARLLLDRIADLVTSTRKA